MYRFSLTVLLGFFVFTPALADAPATQPTTRPDLTALIRLLGDEDWRVREDAQEKLRFQGQAARDALVLASRDADSEIASRATELLKSLDTAKKPIVLMLYEGDKPAKPGQGAQGGAADIGTVHVKINPTDVPLTLLVCAYDPVLWRFEVPAGQKFARVIVGGYHKQKWEGLPEDVKVETQIYENNDPLPVYYSVQVIEEVDTIPEAQAMKAKIETLLGQPVETIHHFYHPREMPAGFSLPTKPLATQKAD